MNIQERFEKHFIPEPNSGCWIWTGGISSNEYGSFGVRYGQKWKIEQAHRVAWIIYRGEIEGELCVCHKCDMPLCVNPDHLFLGTHKENMADMSKKGRSIKPRGENSPRAKVTSFGARVIRQLRGRMPDIDLVNVFGISRSAINRIGRGLFYQ